MSLANKFNLKTSVEDIKEDLEQVPDHIEELEYMTSEINKGLEVICGLSELKEALQKQENNNISLESYNDLALISYNNILKNVGLENSLALIEDTNTDNKNEAKLSDKIKSVIQKIIEIIKKIFVKILDFVKNIFNRILDKGNRVKNSIEDLINTGIIKTFIAQGIEVIAIENPLFFKQDKLLKYDDVYLNYNEKAIKNLSEIISLLNLHKRYVSSNETIESVDIVDKDIDNVNIKFISSLHGRKTSYGINVTPEGYFDLFKEHETSVSKIVFTKHNPKTIVDKQSIVLQTEFPNKLEFVLKIIPKLMNSIDLIRDLIIEEFGGSFEKKLKELKSKIDNETGEKKEVLLNKVKEIKKFTEQLDSLLISSGYYTNDLFNMLLYYNKILRNTGSLKDE